MSTATATPPQSMRGANKARGNRGRGGGSNRAVNRGMRGNAKPFEPAGGKEVKVEKPTEKAAAGAEAPVEEDDADVCWICAEPVKYYAVPECNHRTCHVCALRLRALYKKMDCTFCKEPQTSIIFTVSRDALFSSYLPEAIPHKDAKLSISFETQEMMEETLILLRFNCPDADCDYIGNGWSDLKLHTRAVHGKLLCDLCIRSKKVFSHEHALYPPNVLPFHLPSMHHRQGKPVPKESIEGGVHPLCEFCRDCFFSEDELYVHMRERHEECFICKRNDIRDKYFLNTEALERHLHSAHHPCTQPSCLASRFVVFNTLLDLKAHMVEEHGGDMTARDKKDARRIQAEFAFEEVNHSGRGGRRDRGDREREREPPPHSRQQPQPPQPAHTPDGPARPPNVVNRRREAFGGTLTTEGGANPSNTNNSTPYQSRPSSPPRANLDPAVSERHAAFLARLESLAANPSTAVPVIKSATRGYRNSESSARDLISTIWNVLDRSLEHTASIVNAFVDLLDDDEKKQDLLASWKGFVIEQRRQFPDLVPNGFGTEYAGITSGRVLNAKHSTAIRSGRRSSNQVWDRVAEAASSSGTQPSPARRPAEAFPSLLTATPGPSIVSTVGKGQRKTPWSASSSSGFRPPAAASKPSSTVISRPAVPGSSSHQAPPKLSSSLFPELPSSSSARPKAQVSGNVSLKNILGNPTVPAMPAWQSNTEEKLVPADTPGDPEDATPVTTSLETNTGGGRSKKGKGKQKQTLFTLGTFPT